MKEIIFLIAPTILVPKIGHTVNKEGYGMLKRTNSPASPRLLLARDIKELRRVYRDEAIPNSNLKILIDMNKRMYPNDFSK